MTNVLSGKVFGGMLLVAGSCIGAGMLALPIITGLAGFFPSLFLFFLAWCFMTFTALLLVEVNGWFKSQINIISMAAKSIGTFGRIFSWVLYLFLFYSLLVAYISGSGDIFSSFLSGIIHNSVPSWVMSIFFVLFFGCFVYMGTRPVDVFNRVLIIGLVIAYCGMVFTGLSHIKMENLLHFDTKYILHPLPVLIISFGFHNMIPSLTTYLKNDLKKMRITILGGSLLALLVYIVWEILVIGVIPFSGKDGLLESYQQGEQASIALNDVLGSNVISSFASGFAFFAIVTSFLAQSLSLTHFIADGLKVKPNKKNSLWLCSLALLPPLFFALIYPNIFFKALDFAGGICAVLLFGLLPPVMVWIGRYRNKTPSDYHVKGGKISLVLASLFSLFILIQESIKLFS